MNSCVPNIWGMTGNILIMRDPRFNIASLLGAISFAAVGFAALREANDQWDCGLFSLTLGLLLNAVLLAVHRTEARRAFWIGFALFGWGYLSLSLISSTESRLITTQALVYLDKAHILGHRANVMRVIPDLDRMRDHNLSLDDLLKATQETSMNGSPEVERLRQANGESRTLEYMRGSYVLSLVTRYNKPEQYGNIILKASPEGDILRLRDVATVRLGGSLFVSPGGGMGTTENFVRIGHSLFALIAGWLGGALSRKLRPSH
jgi:AcrB/AcrD/AcrF family